MNITCPVRSEPVEGQGSPSITLREPQGDRLSGTFCFHGVATAVAQRILVSLVSVLLISGMGKPQGPDPAGGRVRPLGPVPRLARR